MDRPDITATPEEQGLTPGGESRSPRTDPDNALTIEEEGLLDALDELPRQLRAWLAAKRRQRWQRGYSAEFMAGYEAALEEFESAVDRYETEAGTNP